MLNLTKQELDENLNLKEGFVVSYISSNDLEIIRSIVNSHWKKVLLSNYPKKFNNPEYLQIYDYQKISDQIDHKKLWPLKNRILSFSDYKKILSTNLFNDIKSIYSDAEVSDENDIGHGEIYWRIVRPKSPKDVGSVHADRWFWEINNNYSPPNSRRIKFWISLWCEGNNGLSVIPNTQKLKYDFDYEFRDGQNKPIFLPEKKNLKLLKLNSKPGTLVVFHDNLLHGGCLNESDLTRVSIEFTIFTKNS
ncbi:phytanoyl-CoA dioxygenase family protein [Candidatus Pelagibacter sp. FZCC0015]|uniref:phytanoyl-CoA dioxygenase family protein n=1 Tax=Candidatus Pelagibacter sp. FZCC0015 TaxID=2268451 RepID=UPI0011AA78AF|nr:phytanoyl-CoA dioxygenase family protein [Candidatus Pelagibacter sp. FZCC0015]